MKKKKILWIINLLWMLTKDNLTPELLENEFKSGRWHEEIAQKYNTSIWTIYKCVEKWKLKIPRRNKKKDVVKLICKDCHKEFTKLEENGLCHNCNLKHQKQKEETPVNTTNSKYLKEVLELRVKGYSYKQIADTIGCSKSTVSYLLSNKVREKRKERVEKYREDWCYYFKRCLSDFRNRTASDIHIDKCYDWKIKLQKSTERFRNRKGNMATKSFTYKDVLEKFGTIVQCELTGQTIDITKDDYNIDHIVPVSKGGTNDLDNLAFTIPEANLAKNSLTNEEFVNLCKRVCEHFGYNVTKL